MIHLRAAHWLKYVLNERLVGGWGVLATSVDVLGEGGISTHP